MGLQMHILPAPQMMRMGITNEIFRLHNADGIVLMGDCGPNGFYYGRLLQRSIKEMTGIFLPVITECCSEKQEGKIILSVSDHLKVDNYEVIISPKTIYISGHSSVDVLYGIQTLRQIVSTQGALLPDAIIHDYPEKKHRGFYHDVTRGRVPRLESLKRLADRCSYYKINELQLYIEHTYLFNGCSEMWRDETPLTAEEIMEFDQYCQRLGIDLIPSISTFGHLYKLLETKTYAGLCELDSGYSRPFSFFRRMRHHTLDATNPKSITLMLTHMDEFMSLFTSKYFNICADETFDLGRGKSAQMAKELGREEVYIRFVQQLCEFVVSRGKIPMFWGDIIASSPEMISVLPKKTICLNWCYDPKPQDTSVKALKAAGATQYLCPGVQGWNDFMNVMPDAYANISQMCQYAYDYNIPGILNTDWGDCGHMSHPDFSAFGLICGTAFSWNKQIPDFETICRQVSVLEYRDSTGTLMQCISHMSTQNVFRWLYVVLFKEMKQSLMSDEPELEQGIQKLQNQVVSGLSAEKICQANKAIEEDMNQLAGYLLQAPEAVKGTLTRFMNAAKGQMIFNEIALHIFCKESGHGTPSQTAVRLEQWFMEYKSIWREYGREGDLGHIQALICWYGDYLRSLESNEFSVG